MNRPSILLGDIHANTEPAPDPHGTDDHDEYFEGSTPLYAMHLIEDHGFTLADLGDLPAGSDQSAWSALNELHHRARRLPENARERFGPDALFWEVPVSYVNGNGEVPFVGVGPDPHDQEFAGDNDAFAKHLIEDHGYKPADVELYRADGGPAGWHTMRNMHFAARMLPPVAPGS